MLTDRAGLGLCAEMIKDGYAVFTTRVTTGKLAPALPMLDSAWVDIQ